jgi:hypothetical protein
LGNRARAHGWRRGLVEEVSTTALKLLTHATTWFRLAPIRRLTVANARNLFRQVLALPEQGADAQVQRLRRLDFAGTFPGWINPATSPGSAGRGCSA